MLGRDAPALASVFPLPGAGCSSLQYATSGRGAGKLHGKTPRGSLRVASASPGPLRSASLRGREKGRRRIMTRVEHASALQRTAAVAVATTEHARVVETDVELLAALAPFAAGPGLQPAAPSQLRVDADGPAPGVASRGRAARPGRHLRRAAARERYAGGFGYGAQTAGEVGPNRETHRRHRVLIVGLVGRQVRDAGIGLFDTFVAGQKLAVTLAAGDKTDGSPQMSCVRRSAIERVWSSKSSSLAPVLDRIDIRPPGCIDGRSEPREARRPKPDGVPVTCDPKRDTNPFLASS